MVYEDPLWQLVGVDDHPDDDGAPVDVDEVVYGAVGRADLRRNVVLVRPAKAS